jgi:superfamily II RNA helicase
MFFLATIYSKLGPEFGVFTRDFRERVETCRILVTVPQCLEILLLSSTHQEWCKRIQYCIFDEIHCMSSILGSEVWERTMLLINCPMIGLSATVNNGQDLRRWIESVEQRRSILFKTPKPREVRFIPHHERLADLNKYLYSNRQLHPLHPVGVMNAKQLSSRGLPKDFSLSPCETLQLNDAMQTSGIKDTQIPTLTEHFSPSWICERSRSNIYSDCVRQQFESLIGNKENCHIDSIATSLRPMRSGDVHYPESKPLSSLIIEFVLTLKEKDLLPCIVFSDNRRLCERMAQCVTDYLAEEERKLRETKYKAEIEAAKKKEIRIERAKKPRESSVKRNKRSTASRDDEREDESHLELSGYERKLLYGVLDECTLVNLHGYDRKLVAKLSKRAAQHHQRLASYMKRGVAYHHAELFNKGRVAVEALFRNRYIQIVFSTATLGKRYQRISKFFIFLLCSDGYSYANENSRFYQRFNLSRCSIISTIIRSCWSSRF